MTLDTLKERRNKLINTLAYYSKRSPKYRAMKSALVAIECEIYRRTA